MSASSPSISNAAEKPALSKNIKAGSPWKRTALVLLLLAAVSMIGNVYQLLRTIPGHDGGGRSADSPDGKYAVSASSLREVNPLHPDYKKLWGRITLIDKSQPQQPLCEIKLQPPGVEQAGGYRELDDLVAWSDDSKSATITLPHARIVLFADAATDSK